MATRKAVVLADLIGGDRNFRAGPDTIDVDEKILARYPSKFEFRGKEQAIANLEALLTETSADEEPTEVSSDEEE